MIPYSFPVIRSVRVRRQLVPSRHYGGPVREFRRSSRLQHQPGQPKTSNRPHPASGADERDYAIPGLGDHTARRSRWRVARDALRSAERCRHCCSGRMSRLSLGPTIACAFAQRNPRVNGIGHFSAPLRNQTEDQCAGKPGQKWPRLTPTPLLADSV